jgi:hypothetical protein
VEAFVRQPRAGAMLEPDTWRHAMLASLFLALAILPVQNPRAILETVRARQVARWDTVQNYSVVQTTIGMEIPLFFEKITVDGQPAFRSVPMAEWSGRTAEQRQQDRNMMGHMADGLDMIADAHEQEVGGPTAAII